MVEMEIILGSFLSTIVARHAGRVHDESELADLDALLREFDNDLYHWLVNVPAKSSLRGNDGDVVPDRLTRNAIWSRLVQHVTASRPAVTGQETVISAAVSQQGA